MELLEDAFGRLRGVVRSVLDDADQRMLTYRPDRKANTIAWLIWHLTRVQDGHIAELRGKEPLWITDGWADRFDLPFDRHASGFGQSAEDVAAVRVEADLLAQYYEDVHAQTIDYLHGLSDEDFAAVVDTSWNPPVTLATRLVSIVSDDLQHAGQAAYVRGMVKRAAL
ncbi:MAG: DinB family protein [Microbacteriaceae bacterium]